MTLKWHGDKVKATIRAAAARGLNKGTEHLLNSAVARVPIEEGELQDSGFASVDNAQLKGVVSFDTPYAVYQHEVEELEHDAGRTWKYLEHPMHEEAPVIKALIAKPIKKAIGS